MALSFYVFFPQRVTPERSMAHFRSAFIYYLGVGIAIASCSASHAFETKEFFVSDFSVTKSASGVPVEFAGKIYISADVNVTSLPIVHLHATVDLGDLQRKIPTIVGTVKLPSANCGSYSANNPVVSLSNSHLSLSNNEAVFHTDGSVAIWDCRENPIPCSEIQWQLKDVGLGIKTKIPVPHTWSCNPPIKNKIATQPFSIDMPFGIKTVTGGAVQLLPGEAKADISGQYVAITKAFIELFKVDLNAKLNDAIKSSLDPSTLTAQIPKEFLEAGLSFQDAKFVTVASDGDLGLDVRADLALTTDTAKEMARLLYEEIKKL
jgi:hypothetical protein